MACEVIGLEGGAGGPPGAGPGMGAAAYDGIVAAVYAGTGAGEDGTSDPK